MIYAIAIQSQVRTIQMLVLRFRTSGQRFTSMERCYKTNGVYAGEERHSRARGGNATPQVRHSNERQIKRWHRSLRDREGAQGVKGKGSWFGGRGSKE